MVMNLWEFGNIGETILGREEIINGNSEFHFNI